MEVGPPARAVEREMCHCEVVPLAWPVSRGIGGGALIGGTGGCVMTDHRHDPTARLSRPGRTRSWAHAVLGVLPVLVLATSVMAAPSSAAFPSAPASAAGGRPGALDRTFGGDGRVTTDFGEGMDSGATALVLQPDGKVVAAGRAGLHFQAADFALARYRRDGTLDRRFGDGGLVTTDFGGGDDFGRAVARQRDGKLVVAGHSFTPDGSGLDFALARYNPDGSLDPTFGTGGTVTTDVLGGDDFASDLVLQADGKLVVGGTTAYVATPGELTHDFALVRYDPDGSLDTSFGTDGKVVTSIGPYDDLGGLALQPGGRLVAVGHTDGPGPIQGLSFVRYRRDGSLDPSFDGDGIANPDVAGIGYAYALIVQADGKLLAGGSGLAPSGVETGFGLVRLHRDGSLDTGFGTGGGTITMFPDRVFAIIYDLVEHDDGRLTAAGDASGPGSTTQFALASYRPDGSLDRRFGHDGRVLTSFTGDLNEASGLVLQEDGKLVAAGTTSQPDAAFASFALARYHGRRSHS
jgi:uncharacterized delta-60 repeat protein